MRPAWLTALLLGLGAACGPKTETTCPEPEATASDPAPAAAEVRRTIEAYTASTPAPNMAPMAVRTVVAIDGGAAVLLQEPTGGGRVVPIMIGTAEGMAIALRLEGEKYQRPLTHDLLESILAAHDLKVGRVEIHDLRDGTFHGRVVVLDPSGRTTEIDARASDSIALALGTGAEVYMAEHVLDQTGVSPESLGLNPDGSVQEAEGESPPAPP